MKRKSNTDSKSSPYLEKSLEELIQVTTVAKQPFRVVDEHLYYEGSLNQDMFYS